MGAGTVAGVKGLSHARAGLTVIGLSTRTPKGPSATCALRCAALRCACYLNSHSALPLLFYISTLVRFPSPLPPYASFCCYLHLLFWSWQHVLFMH